MYEDLREEIYRSYTLSLLSDDQLRDVIRQTISHRSRYRNRGEAEKEEMVQTVFSSIRGLGILDKLLQEEELTEIMVNDYNRIFIERGSRVERSNASFSSEQELFDCIQRMVSRAGREVNQANPIVDIWLPGGERVNVVLPPVSLDGPIVTIRRFPKQRITMDRLISFGSITAEAAAFLQKLVESKYNIFISGGTSSGKTTFLNALSDFIPKDERIITIEDSAELQITGVENLVRMETRNANSSGSGAVSMQQLIKTSLRMRPERIIVGEVRGKEAMDMLNAMNTGHDGSISTGHANSSFDMLRRLESMVLQGNAALPLAAVRRDIASSLDILVHLKRISGRRRVVASIEEVIGLQDEQIQLNPLYLWQGDCLCATGNTLVHTFKIEEYRKEDADEAVEADLETNP